MDEFIDNKSQRLFKIRDELSKLFEQARILQFEINQLSATQAENIREFLLLCVHLDTYPKQNSNLKEKTFYFLFVKISIFSIMFVILPRRFSFVNIHFYLF
ncbi:hypothetical protein H5410_025304 [Solanum commersonii]|uniref:Uncharacterized protein n=1 Tax=Solanum commersonii TaxID=4109 RepID=A0A9J5YXK6_SOLCO|nr:hypothetical protein H5410_025304 [Solanum commersonii]